MQTVVLWCVDDAASTTPTTSHPAQRAANIIQRLFYVQLHSVTFARKLGKYTIQTSYTDKMTSNENGKRQLNFLRQKENFAGKKTGYKDAAAALSDFSSRQHSHLIHACNFCYVKH